MTVRDMGRWYKPQARRIRRHVDHQSPTNYVFPRMGRCAYCTRADPFLTRDHILPRARGRLFREGGPVAARVSNYRWACARCNTMRGSLDHCPAVLMLVLDVARATATDPQTIARRWRQESSRP